MEHPSFISANELYAKLTTDIEQVNGKRLELVAKRKKNILKSMIILGTIALALQIYLYTIDPASLGLLFLSVPGVLIISWLIGFRIGGEFRATYKTLVLSIFQEIIKDFNEKMLTQSLINESDLKNDVHYQLANSMSTSTFNHMQLFDRAAEWIHTEDHFQGKLGKTAFDFLEAHAGYTQETTNSNGGTQRQEVTLFRGILFSADFNKKFKSITTVRSKAPVKKSLRIIFSIIAAFFIIPISLSIFGSFTEDPESGFIFGGVILVVILLLFRKFFRKKQQQVELESVEFNKQFNVTSDDQIEARYILTSSLFERLMELRQRLGNHLTLTFKDHNVYLAFAMKNSFEHHFSKPITSETIALEHGTFTSILSIIEELDLNTRIWSKD